MTEAASNVVIPSPDSAFKNARNVEDVIARPSPSKTSRAVQFTTETAPGLNYKSPQQTYAEALNFDAHEDRDGGSGGGASAAVSETDSVSDLQSKFKHLVKSINDSEILYPTVVLVVSAISLLVVVFQKSVSAVVKCVLILLYLAILVVTVFTFKNKV